MRERLRVSLEKNSTLEEELNLTKEEVSFCMREACSRVRITKIILSNSFSFHGTQLQQIRSGAIQLSNQNDGTKSGDGNKVSTCGSLKYQHNFPWKESPASFPENS